MKKTATILACLFVVTAILCFQAIGADKQKFCNNYADTAVKQYNLGKQHHLPGIVPPVWSNDRKGHKDWCLRVSESIVKGENDKRQAYLDKNIPKKGSGAQFVTGAVLGTMTAMPNLASIAGLLKADSTYLGCFKDQKNRDISGFSFKSPKMTKKLCMDTCRQKGFKYAGLQYSQHCFCGNSYGKLGKSDNCKMPCSGNKGEICGGGWANSVYQVESASSNAVVTLEGSSNQHAAYQPAQQVIIRDMMASKNSRFSVGHNIKKGSIVYRDRNFLYWDVPVPLQGLDYLITNNNDKFSSGKLFTIKHPASPITFYVAVDPQNTVPAWIIRDGYENTYQLLKIWIPDNNRFASLNIYKKHFPKGGTISFGGNQNSNSKKQGNMYVVIADSKNIKTTLKFEKKEKSGYEISGYATVDVHKAGKAVTFEDKLVSEKRVEDENNNRVCATQKRKLKSSRNSFFLLNDQREDTLFPGNILSIAEIENGNFVSSHTPLRKPYHLSTDLPGSPSSSGNALVSQPSINFYRNARNQLLASLNINKKFGSKASLGKFSETSSEVDFMVRVTGGVSSLFHSAGGRFSYQNHNKKNHYLVEIEKIYYDIDFDPSEGFFQNPNIPLSSDWIYVSKVRYGTKLILNIESNYSQKNVEAAIKYRYNGLAVTGGGKVETEYRRTLSDIKIETISLGEQPAKYLSQLIYDPSGKSFANLFSYSKIDLNTRLYPLSYTLRYVNDNKIAEIETYADYNQLICKKLKEIIRIKIEDIYVARSDDGRGGEELYGWLSIYSPKYGQKIVFSNHEDNHFPETEGGNRIEINGQTIFYLKFSKDEINHPDSYIELEAQMMEDDSGDDDNFGYVFHKLPLRELVAGALKNDYSEEKATADGRVDVKLQYVCDDCKVMKFGFEDSVVFIRYTVELLDILPPGVKVGF